MNNEEKARAYDKALNWMRAIYQSLSRADKEDAEHFFPELCEGEDERIRKALIGHLKAGVDFVSNGVTKAECIAWLEKQKEQKQELPLMDGDTDTYFDDLRMTTKPLTSREWFDEGIKYAQRLQKEQKPAEWSEDIIRKAVKEIGLTQHQIDWFKDNVFPSKVEWSEEDEGMLNCIIATLCEESHGGREANDKMVTWLENRLKSLRPVSKESLQPHWKPSEEEERLIKTSISFLKDFADKGYENAVECIDWLKSKLNGDACK